MQIHLPLLGMTVMAVLFCFWLKAFGFVPAFQLYGGGWLQLAALIGGWLEIDHVIHVNVEDRRCRGCCALQLAVLNTTDGSSAAAEDVSRASMLLELMLMVSRAPSDKLYTIGSVRSPHGTFVDAPKERTTPQSRMLELSQEFIMHMKTSDELGSIR